MNNFTTIALNYKKLINEAIEPTHGSAEAAGYDLYVPSSIKEIMIPAHETIKIGIGIAIELPINTFGAIFARSGLATKEGLRPANCTGVIDSDYRGEVVIALHNDTNNEKIIHGGDRIAQLVVIPYISVKFEEINELEETERDKGGFGSTGR